MEVSEEMYSDDEKDSEVNERFQELVRENEERRKSMERDLQEINSRLDYNKKAMEDAKHKIERITNLLHSLREHTIKYETMQINDDWSSSENQKPNGENEKLVTKCRAEFTEISNSLEESLNKSEFD